MSDSAKDMLVSEVAKENVELLLTLLQIVRDMWYKFSWHFQDKWESHANTDKPFELFEQISLMTLDTIMKCAFSHKSNCQTERWDLFPFSDDVYSVTGSSLKMNWDGMWMDELLHCFPWLVIDSTLSTWISSLESPFSETNAYIKSIFKLTQLINLRLRTFPYHSDFIFYLSPHGYRYRKACEMARTHTGTVLRCNLSKENTNWLPVAVIQVWNDPPIVCSL